MREEKALPLVAEVAQGNTAWEAARMEEQMNSATEEQDWALPSSPAKQRGSSTCFLYQPSRKAKAALISLCTVANVFGFPLAVDDLGAKIFVVWGSGEVLSIMHS